MIKYNIIDEEGNYWSRNDEFGYWSPPRFNDEESIRRRLIYNYINGKLKILNMAIFGTKAVLVEVSK